MSFSTFIYIAMFLIAAFILAEMFLLVIESLCGIDINKWLYNKLYSYIGRRNKHDE